MKGYTATLPNGEAIYYVDRKRYLWMMSVLYPLQPLLGIWLHSVTGVEAWLLLPLLLGYVLIPLADWIAGEDKNNPPEEVVLHLHEASFDRDHDADRAPQGVEQLDDLLVGLEGLADDIEAAAADAEPRGAWNDMVSVVRSDADATLAAIRLVASRPGISSQLIDNLNANIHLRALLTDLFLVDELIAG